MVVIILHLWGIYSLCVNSRRGEFRVLCNAIFSYPVFLFDLYYINTLLVILHGFYYVELLRI